MNRIFTSIIVAAAALLASCAGSESAGEGGEGKDQPEGLSCTAAPIENVTDGSRSQLTLGSAGMDFSWENGDKLTVFYAESDQTAGTYTLEENSIRENGTFARFTNDAFGLVDGKRYYAISTTEGSGAPSGVSIPSKSNIKLTYAGQIQNGNGTTTHLGKYDYMAASGVASAGNHADFDFKHLGLTLRVIMDHLPTTAKFTRMEMYDTEDSYRQPLRDFDLTSGMQQDGTYTPALTAVDVNATDYKTSSRFSLTLQNGGEGITPRSSDGRLDMFIEVPPADLTNKTLVFMVYGKQGDNDVSYYITKPGRDLVAGKAYQMMDNAQSATSYNVTIKVNHAWQLGSTLDSRATGDPGVEEKFDYPKNLYYILCVNGLVRKAKSEDTNYYTEIENIPTSGWTRSANNTISTYNVQQHFSFTSDEMSQSRNLYVVASNDDLSSIFSSAISSSTTTETLVQNLVYSINTTDAQAFMKNLYSTPWKSGDAFVGNLGSDYFKDIILYHVAAKVDLKWNSDASVIDNTYKTVNVNNVQSTNLSLFQPATVNGTSTFVSASGDPTYTVTSTIEPDRMFNGRQVFYLPQPANATYNVTVGKNAATNITFTPVTTNGFTSWLRWLKNYTTAP